MASQSSQRKSDTSVKHEDIADLLRDGATFLEPSPEILKAAKHLEKYKLIASQLREFVVCADPQDGDFPPKNRHCRERIYLDKSLDEEGHEFRCPECERPVFPFRYRKRRHKELHSRVMKQGVKDYVLSVLKKLKIQAQEEADFVHRITLDDSQVWLCIADYCGDDKYRSRDWASMNSTCYLVVNKKTAEERFLKEEWIACITLAEIICGTVDIKKRLQELVKQGPPRTVAKASVPVFTQGARPIVFEPVAPAHPERSFVVEVGTNTVRVEGEVVVAPQAGTRFEIFQILWGSFLDDLKAGASADGFKPLTIEALAEELQKHTGEYAEDITTIRRTVNRLQEDIEKAVKKKLGMPIDREDIIQTCRWEGQGKGDHGYRINPLTVVARPYNADKPQDLS